MRIAAHNAMALEDAIHFCAEHGIGSFRVNSQILPLRTHPELGYDAGLLGEQVVERYRRAGRLAQTLDVRLTFHPDQFVVLSSPRSEVVESSLCELEYQAEVATWIGADLINIHAGGGYGDKRAALRRLARNLGRLSEAARSRVSLENDDRVYTPDDLLQLCRYEGIPLVYDVHHHRVNEDGLSVEAATELALFTWHGREPLFHISSPLGGWKDHGGRPQRHADYIDPRDLPRRWLGLEVTVEVEAKAKEVAVLRLMEDLGYPTWRRKKSASLRR